MPILIVLALLIGGPLLELSVLVDVAREIGTLPAIGLTVLTAVVGLYIVRLQGFMILRKMQEESASGRPPVAELMHGFFLFIAGVCLFIPGFITDTIGVLLLFPPIRLLLGRFGLQRMFVGTAHQPVYRNNAGQTIIEGEYSIAEDDEGANDDTASPRPLDPPTN